MQVENQNIIFTVFNKNLVYTLAVFEVISAVIVALFFTVIRAEYIVLVLPFVFFVFVLPIFMIGMRNKIIYRLTADELQYRGANPSVIKWTDIKSYNIENNQIIINLQNGKRHLLPLFNFNIEEINKAFGVYINNYGGNI